MIINSKTSGL